MNQKKQTSIATQREKLAELQGRYPFKQSLLYYYMGKTGKPEQVEQKTAVHCLRDNFGGILGEYEDRYKSGKVWKTRMIYPALIVSVADFYDSQARTNMKTGARWSKKMDTMKDMGYEPNSPDIIIMVPRAPFTSFVCEMKRLSGNASQGQKTTLAHLSSQGASCHICQGYAEFLERWLHYVL